jgi:hypothetical protein
LVVWAIQELKTGQAVNWGGPNLGKRTAYSARGSIEHDMPKSDHPSLFGRAGTDRYRAPVCDNVKRHSSAASIRGNSRN